MHQAAVGQFETFDIMGQIADNLGSKLGEPREPSCWQATN
ncbi:hypothetical protein OKW39_005598 [Paraburkholderia sp. MM6662-R1]